MPAKPAAEESKVPMVRNVILAAVALLIIFFGYWWYQTHEKTRILRDGTRVVTAPKGDVVSGFPQDLIVEEGVRAAGSYRIEYPGGTSQPAISYVSAKSLADNVAMFAKYLADNGWNVTNAASATSTRPTFFYATKPDGKTLNVTFASQPDGRIQVLIGYAAPRQ